MIGCSYSKEGDLYWLENAPFRLSTEVTNFKFVVVGRENQEIFKTRYVIEE